MISERQVEKAAEAAYQSYVAKYRAIGAGGLLSDWPKAPDWLRKDWKDHARAALDAGQAA